MIMKIFTYGALMSAKYMEEIGVDPSTRQRATLHDHELRFAKQSSDNPQKSYATVSPVNGKSVYGIVYDVPERSMAILDMIEDYPHGYTRETVTVMNAGDKDMQVTIYIANPDMLVPGLLPSEEYIQKLLESEDLLPPDYIKWLKHHPTLVAL
jgi:gamma-glutamylcyclotransferase (GGCT)/AIG2-like uncharacterized protein YtfP